MNCRADGVVRKKPAKLTKQQRETVRLRYEGRCAYCGDLLGPRWHADHFESIGRQWWKKDGGMDRPENDTLGNLMPACAPCNIDKHVMTLEVWRTKLQQGCRVLRDNHATYRHSLRFGLVSETGAAVVFYFERKAAEQRDICQAVG